MSPTLRSLAWLELRRYVRHPLFLSGVALVVLSMFAARDPRSSVAGNAIIPAAVLGILGIGVMASLVRRSDRLHAASGAAPVPERTRTLALAAAAAAPFGVALIWWIWAVFTLRAHPAAPNGYPFAGHDGAWINAVMFAQGPMACLGGPLFGLMVGRFTRGRATPALAAVGMLAFCIVWQPLAESLRRVRVLSPWTHWGGQFGIEGDPDRTLILTGSPQWWIIYLACLCVLAVLAALLHDPDGPRRRLWRLSAAVGVVTVAVLLLAMWMGTPHQLVNPLPT